MHRLITTLLVIIAALAATSIWAWHSRQELKARIAELERRLVADPVKPVPEAASSSSATAATKLAPESPTESVPIPKFLPEDRAQQEKEVRDHLRKEAQRQREMMRDPAYRKAQVDTARRRFASTRADAIRAVGMTPAQADRVIDLWVERNMRYAELSQGNPGEPPSADVQAEIKLAADAEQVELLELLGQEKYERWGRYLASGEERGEVSQLRAEFANSEQPIRDSHADALVDVIYTERQRRSNEYEEYVKSMGITDRNVVSRQDRQRWLDLEMEANQRIHTAATGMLSSSQLASLDEMLAARLAPVEAALRLQR